MNIESSQEEGMKKVIAKQNNMIKEQSDQMLSMVDIINVYSKESEELRSQIDQCGMKNTNAENQLRTAQSLFEIQILLFVLLILLLIWYSRQ